MASGFIILPDGRCFSKRWSAHDAVLRMVAEAVDAIPLRRWLLDQLPGPDDEEELGYGAWWSVSKDECVRRFIDLRLMTEENQGLFCEAVKHAASVSRADEWLAVCIGDFADMVARMERGEPPLSKSDWVIPAPPPEGKPMGPGWAAAG